MADADDPSARYSVGTFVNRLKEIRFLLFDVSAKRIAAKIGNLNHSGQFAIDEQRSFAYPQNVGPKGPRPMKIAHHRCMFARDGIIIIMNDETVALLTSIHQVLFKSRNDLLERLLPDRSLRQCRIEVQFINAFGEQAREAPTGDALRDLPNYRLSLLEREMNVCIGLRKVFLRLAISGMVVSIPKAQQNGCALSEHSSSSVFGR